MYVLVNFGCTTDFYSITIKPSLIWETEKLLGGA